MFYKTITYINEETAEGKNLLAVALEVGRKGGADPEPKRDSI